MVGQSGYEWYAGSSDIYVTNPLTVQVKNSETGKGRDTFAEVALGRVNDISEGDGVWGQIMITQVVSDSGVENFGERLAVYRKHMTSVTVELMVWNTHARGRLMLNFWS
jgi:hypothetical protein